MDCDPLTLGQYDVPYQMISMILLGPGTTVSHDALRLCARHGTAIADVGEDGVRCYTAPPLIPDRSGLARRQARVWGDADGARIDIARIDRVFHTLDTGHLWLQRTGWIA